MDCGALRLAGRAAGTTGATAMNCDPAELASLSRCYCFGSKWRSVLAYIYCQWANNLTPSSPINWLPESSRVEWEDVNGVFVGDLDTFLSNAVLDTVIEINFNIDPGTITEVNGMELLPSLEALNLESQLLTTYSISHPTLQIISIPVCANLTALSVAGCPQLNNVIASVNPVLSSINVASCPLLTSCTFDLNALGESAVDAVLCALDTNGAIGGLLHIENNVPPGAAGVACAASLDPGKGWTVFTD